MPDETDREALVDTLIMTPMADRHGLAPVYRTAAAILASDWLAADRAATRRQALDEAVEALSGFDCLTDLVPSHVDVPDDYEAGMHDAARIVANLRDGGEG